MSAVIKWAGLFVGLLIASIGTKSVNRWPTDHYFIMAGIAVVLTVFLAGEYVRVSRR